MGVYFKLVPIFLQKGKLSKTFSWKTILSVCACAFDVPLMVQFSYLQLTHAHKQKHFIESLRGNSATCRPMNWSKPGMDHEGWLGAGPNPRNYEETEKATDKIATTNCASIRARNVTQISPWFHSHLVKVPLGSCLGASLRIKDSDVRFHKVKTDQLWMRVWRAWCEILLLCSSGWDHDRARAKRLHPQQLQKSCEGPSCMTTVRQSWLA